MIRRHADKIAGAVIEPPSRNLVDGDPDELFEQAGWSRVHTRMGDFCGFVPPGSGGVGLKYPASVIIEQPGNALKAAVAADPEVVEVQAAFDAAMTAYEETRDRHRLLVATASERRRRADERLQEGIPAGAEVVRLGVSDADHATEIAREATEEAWDVVVRRRTALAATEATVRARIKAADLTKQG